MNSFNPNTDEIVWAIRSNNKVIACYVSYKEAHKRVSYEQECNGVIYWMEAVRWYN